MHHECHREKCIENTCRWPTWWKKAKSWHHTVFVASCGFRSVTCLLVLNLNAMDSHAGWVLKLPLLCVCVNHYLRCSQNNGTSWEYGLCDAGERCCQNTELKERQSREGEGGRERNREGREEGPTARDLLLKHVIWRTGGPVSASACCAAKLCSNPQNFI